MGTGFYSDLTANTSGSSTPESQDPVHRVLSLTPRSPTGRWSLVRTSRPTARRLPVLSAGGVDPRIVVGDSDRPELRVFDVGGSLQLLIRNSGTREAITPSDLDSWKETRLAPLRSDADRARQMETALRNLTVPEFKPAFGRPLGVTPNGFVWVANYALYPASSDFLWVFDREGGYVGTVRLPAGTGPWPHQFELGADYLLVVVFDDLGVETVRYYPLREPSPNGD